MRHIIRGRIGLSSKIKISNLDSLSDKVPYDVHGLVGKFEILNLVALQNKILNLYFSFSIQWWRYLSNDNVS